VKAGMTFLILERADYPVATLRFPTLPSATIITAKRVHGAVVSSVSLNNGTAVR
jgi:hypothetical protein